MQATGRHTYYEILEIPSSAPEHQVINAYERACSTYASDNPAIRSMFSQQEAEELLVMIEEAYQVLGNKVLRKIYDDRLMSGQGSLNDLSFDSILEASSRLAAEKKAAKKSPTYIKDPDFENEIQAQEHWTGEFLKSVREYQQISVERMSEITKINSWYITAIERIEPSSLPATVFVRGYIVQIARAMGLDDKKVADSYMKFYKSALGK